MRPPVRLAGLAGLSLLVPLALGRPAPADEPPASAGRWQRWEASLTGLRERARPDHDVAVDVAFRGPDGATLRVPAFWDGDRTFRFRAAFPAAGTWRWRSSCDDPSDAGLHDRRGVVEVAPAAVDNPFHRHGALRVSDDRRYLVHADGTPFLWMGDTGWNVAWKATMDDWREYVETRAGQGFSVLQVVATGLDLRSLPDDRRGATPERTPFRDDGAPNPAFWRDLEDRVAVANDRGLIVMLTGLGQSRYAEHQDTEQFARVLAGRFAGHMVIFSPSMDQRIDELNDRVGARLRPLTTHLIAQHPGTDFEAARHYHDADYTDVSSLQSGHRSGRIEAAYEGAREWTLALWHREPVKPVINVEAMYDAHGHDEAPNWREQDARKLGWISWLSGSRGYTYGAGDVPPKVPEGRGAIWAYHEDPEAYDSWRKAIRWPSAGQMTHLRDFFAAIEWWRLEPSPGRVVNQADEFARKMAVSQTPERDLLVAYLPDNAEIVLDLGDLPGAVRGTWFNPVTAERQVAPMPPLPDPGATFRRPDGWRDAVLLLEGD